MEIATVIRKGKYRFNDAERNEMAQVLASKQLDKCHVEDEKKSVMSDFKDQLDRLQLDINTISRKVIDGYEMRDFECHVSFNFKEHKKYFISTLTGEIIEERPLDPSDYQHQFDLDDDKDKEPEQVQAAIPFKLPEDPIASTQVVAEDAQVVDIQNNNLN